MSFGAASPLLGENTMCVRLLVLWCWACCIFSVSVQADHYIFGWPFVENESMEPRGGTSRGPEVELETDISEVFKAIHADNISDFERDRRAILAMQGPYRVSFDFLEVSGYTAAFSPARPYRSWGTEYVYVVADEGEFISLQHVLVMSIIDKEGNTIGPFVTKHWRQDWRYEPATTHRYRGANTWERERIPRKQRRKAWVQTVWQVDDSPRYSGWGKWQHENEYSTWESNDTWRPLPRREYSVRKDYDVLIGRNSHTVTVNGWVQQEHNDKVVLEKVGVDGKRLSREYGIARYERIKNYDFGPGDEYMKATGGFWNAVRDHWNKVFDENKTVSLRAPIDQQSLFMTMFGRAQAIADGEAFDEQQNAEFIAETIKSFMADAPGKKSGY